MPQAEEPGGLHCPSGLHCRGVRDLAGEKGDARGLGDQAWVGLRCRGEETTAGML